MDVNCDLTGSWRHTTAYINQTYCCNKWRHHLLAITEKAGLRHSHIGFTFETSSANVAEKHIKLTYQDSLPLPFFLIQQERTVQGPWKNLDKPLSESLRTSVIGLLHRGQDALQ